MDEYLRITMIQLSNILCNASQPSQHENIDEVLDSIKGMLENYNRVGGNINIMDFRK